MTTGQKIESQLDNLNNIREDLIDNLETKGIPDLSGDEKFNELVQIIDTELVKTPNGKIEITQNGTDIDVSSYATADVAVPEPTGTINIVSNGITNVSAYASANVNVPSQKYAPKTYMHWGNYTDVTSSRFNGTDLLYETTNLDTSNITSMYAMFCYCKNLTTLDLSGWNTSNVTDMMLMFKDCRALVTIPGTANLNTSKVTSFYSMFENCTSLTTLDLSGWNTSGGQSQPFYSMFQGCSSLTTLDFSNATLKSTLTGSSNLSYMFSGCSSLQHLDIRKMKLSQLSSAPNNFVNKVPTNCEIIVKDATEKNWWSRFFSTYTNVKTVAEYEASL